MSRIIDAWDCTKRGDFILTLEEQIPRGFFRRCRIDSKEYSLVTVHLFGVTLDVLLRHVGIKADVGVDFVGKEIEFIE